MQIACTAVADQDDGSPVVAVGDVPGGEHKEQPWKEKRQASESKVECRAGHLVDLPGDGDRLGLGAEDDEETGGLVQAKVAGQKCACRTRFRHTTVLLRHVPMLSYSGRGTKAESV